MTSTVETIKTAFEALIADLGIPADFLVTETGTRYGTTTAWTRLSIDLPDGTTLRAYDEDTRIVVQVVDINGELSRLSLDNVSDALLLAVLEAIVAESLKD